MCGVLLGWTCQTPTNVHSLAGGAPPAGAPTASLRKKVDPIDALLPEKGSVQAFSAIKDLIGLGLTARSARRPIHTKMAPLLLRAVLAMVACSVVLAADSR